ncbi:hypothetical protein [Paenarthrobacter histidinolovorans]|uniref:hypothetical protein n=1 Tax=Paenarthrobacter histidinolovorans TaxID=43664 RepID=UPI0016678485|nr:hypothetical protein [Paenarthrobacter histidinolovorans]GGJ17896.1 hypothetical protein GCM10010052_13950 [Paenarthrobacter histidinolovorans]
MTLGLAFIAIGLVWLPFRKWIARRQYWISSQMFGRKLPIYDAESLEADSELHEERVRGLEMLGVFFCSVLIVGGLVIVLLTVVFRPPWSGA